MAKFEVTTWTYDEPRVKQTTIIEAGSFLIDMHDGYSVLILQDDFDGNVAAFGQWNQIVKLSKPDDIPF